MSTPSKRNKPDGGQNIDPKRLAEIRLAQWVDFKFKESWATKQPYEQLWDEMKTAYSGTLYKNANKPSYKSDHISNYIYKTIETIRPIMIDNNPRFQAMPRKESGIGKDTLIQTALTFEYDRERVRNKVTEGLVDMLVIGNMMFYVPWDAKDDGVGNTKVVPINPYNYFPDPNATCIDDSEYGIIAKYMSEEEVKQMYPEKTKEVKGEGIKYTALQPNNKTSGTGSGSNNQVLVLIMFLRDHSVMEDEIMQDDKKYLVRKKRYPNGRQVTVIPSYNIVVDDKPIPYKDGKFPIVHIKNHQVPFEFWGKSDVEQLLSPQKYMNDLFNQVIDNARHMANPAWIIDKNAGIGKGKLTNRPGIVVRKNPGTNVERPTPPGMPAYVFNTLSDLRNDVETISGVHDTLAGERPVGIQNASAINSLQEAGQARIRLKVKMLEDGLSELGQMNYSRMQQFWKLNRFIRVTDEEGTNTFKEIRSEDLKEDFDIKVFAGSTMPDNKQAKLDLMIRLAQTPAEDGFPMVDRRAILHYVDVPDKSDLIDRMEKLANEVPNGVDELRAEMEAQHKEYGGLFKEIMGAIKELSADVNQVQKIQEKEAQASQLEKAQQKGYEQGLKQIPPDLQGDEQEALGMQRQSNFENQVNNGIIPTEVLDELLDMPDQQLQQILEQNPELREMLMQNLSTQQPR